ncbi:hypothetical protein RSSE_p1521 (plasmid) [Ralstonia solanacearum]|nr:hypothetical protein RSSE_p1521 [Ralstonia solanacearum]
MRGQRRGADQHHRRGSDGASAGIARAGRIRAAGAHERGDRHGNSHCCRLQSAAIASGGRSARWVTCGHRTAVGKRTGAASAAPHRARRNRRGKRG